MKFKELTILNQEILFTREPPPWHFLKPVINLLLPTQHHLIISSDPSSDTNKSKPVLEKHSGFEERILALIFFGSDSEDSVEKIRLSYARYKEKFLRNFYWSHYSKTYAGGTPRPFWAQRFLLREIELFEPQVIVIFGNCAARFCLGGTRLLFAVFILLEIGI